MAGTPRGRPSGSSRANGAWSSAPPPRPGSSSTTRWTTSRPRSTPPCSGGRRRSCSPRTTCSGTSSSPIPTRSWTSATPTSLFEYARRHRQLVLAAHLVWDEGFGEDWPEDYLWELDKPDAEKLLFGTARAMVRRYRGRAAGWIVANEVTSPIGDDADELGFRTNVPWYQTIGRELRGPDVPTGPAERPARHPGAQRVRLRDHERVRRRPDRPPGGDPQRHRHAAAAARAAGRAWASRPTCSPRTGTASIPGSTAGSSSRSPTAA